MMHLPKTEALDLRPEHILSAERLAPQLKGIETRAKDLARKHQTLWVYAYTDHDESRHELQKRAAQKILTRRQHGIGHPDNAKNITTEYSDFRVNDFWFFSYEKYFGYMHLPKTEALDLRSDKVKWEEFKRTHTIEQRANAAADYWRRRGTQWDFATPDEDIKMGLQYYIAKRIARRQKEGINSHANSLPLLMGSAEIPMRVLQTKLPEPIRFWLFSCRGD
jgi:hypothetical protein